MSIQVEYRSAERNIPTQSVDVAGNTTNHVLLDNLRKFVTYEIRVLAYTRMGDGVPSSPEVVVQTNADGMSSLFLLVMNNAIVIVLFGHLKLQCA